MKTLVSISFYFLFIVGVLSCDRESERESTPNFELAKEYGIDPADLVYQYYQNFGFTDVCEDLRMVSELSSSPNFAKNLPVNSKDLKVINEMPNRVDHFDGSNILFKTNSRDAFYSIELEFINFIQDTNLIVKTKKGQYQIINTDSTSIFKLYDSDSKLLYTEVHRCDGK